MMLPDGQQIEAGTTKLTAEDGRVFFRKEGRIYDEMGNNVPAREIRGAILGGICGHPTCHCGNARWRDSSLDTYWATVKSEDGVPERREFQLLVCDACAAEKNDRAESLRKSQPCQRVDEGGA